MIDTIIAIAAATSAAAAILLAVLAARAATQAAAAADRAISLLDMTEIPNKAQLIEWSRYVTAAYYAGIAAGRDPLRHF